MSHFASIELGAQLGFSISPLFYGFFGIKFNGRSRIPRGLNLVNQPAIIFWHGGLLQAADELLDQE